MHCNAKVTRCVRKYGPLCTAGEFMHYGWKKICRSVCRKMDVFVQRRWLCNLITSVASVADSGITCSCSVSITCLKFVALPAARAGDLGRAGEIPAQLLTRFCLSQAAFGTSVLLAEFPRDREFTEEEEEEGEAGPATPGQREAPGEPRQGGTMVPLSGALLRKVTPQPGARVHGNSWAEEEQNRN